MSSISSSDRSRQTDEVRKAREEYEAKEAENYKKTRKQLQKMAQQQTKALEEAKEQYGQQVDAIRQRSRDSIDKRDENHVQQVDQLRSMYHEQLRRKAEDSEQMRKSQQEARESEGENHSRISKQQAEVLTRNQRDALSERDRQMEEYTERSRREMADALANRTKNMNEKHDAATDALIQDRNRSAAEQKKLIGDQKSTYQNRIRDIQSKNRIDKEKSGENWMHVLRDQEAVSNSILDNRNELLKAEKQDLQRRYANKIEDKTQEMDDLREKLREDVSGRYEREVRTARHEELQAKSKNLQDGLSADKLRKVEKENLVMQYEDRMRDIQKQQDGMKEASTRIIHRRVNDVIDKSDKIVQETNRNNRLKADLIVTKNKEDRVSRDEQSTARLQHLRNQTDSQVRRIMKSTVDEQRVQKAYHQDSLEHLKNNYVDRLSAQRDAHMEGLSNVRVDLDQRMKQHQVKSQKKIETMAESYEIKLKALEEAHREEITSLKKGYEVRQKQQVLAGKADQESHGQKYELKFNQREDEHKREIERIQKRHEERLADMAHRAEFYRKKA